MLGQNITFEFASRILLADHPAVTTAETIAHNIIRSKPTSTPF